MSKLNQYSPKVEQGQSIPAAAPDTPRLTDRADLLDQPIWSALDSAHCNLAVGDDLARRYPKEIGPFAAMREARIEAYNSLNNLISD